MQTCDSVSMFKSYFNNPLLAAICTLNQKILSHCSVNRTLQRRLPECQKNQFYSSLHITKHKHNSCIVCKNCQSVWPSVSKGSLCGHLSAISTPPKKNKKKPPHTHKKKPLSSQSTQTLKCFLACIDICVVQT